MADASPPDSVSATILAEGELVVVGRIRSASNAALVCDAVGGDETELRCVYKPVRGEVPLWDFPDGTLAGREVASYLISDALGWSVIPETVLRDGPAGPGMVQRWVETVDAPDDPARLDLVDLCPPALVPEDFKSVLEAYTPAGDPVVLVHADDPRLQRMAVLDVVLEDGTEPEPSLPALRSDAELTFRLIWELSDRADLPRLVDPVAPEPDQSP